jgi:ATP-dependent RNA helicase SUPV3L1/SUV3
MPSFEQLELFSLQLPNLTMKELLGLFSDLARLDGSYFLRDMEPMKAIAEVLEPVRMSLRHRFTFMVAPADHRDNTVMLCLLKMARQFSQNVPLAGEDVCSMVKWPLSRPSGLSELEYVESVHKVLDIYLWLK